MLALNSLHLLFLCLFIFHYLPYPIYYALNCLFFFLLVLLALFRLVILVLITDLSRLFI